jgi:transcriptional regulator GlxA family with amidase domain
MTLQPSLDPCNIVTMSKLPAGSKTVLRGNLVVPVYAGAEILDIAGPVDLLNAAGMATEHSNRGTLKTPLLVSIQGGLVATFPAGIGLHTETLDAVRGKPIDTLLVPGGLSAVEPDAHAELLPFIRACAQRARRVVSVCTGAFLLAEAGLLDGRRATTHWAFLDEFRARFRAVTVEPDAIFVEDGNVYTSAGISAGMDLALHLVEQDYGTDKALELARYWLLYVKRPGGQSQFSALLPQKAGTGDRIDRVKAWALDNLDADLSVSTLAEQAQMSARHFARVFRDETGMTPARYVEVARVEAARRRLEAGVASLDRVASECGMGDAERMRRSFIRRLGVNPNHYRQRFARVGLQTKETH